MSQNPGKGDESPGVKSPSRMAESDGHSKAGKGDESSGIKSPARMGSDMPKSGSPDAPPAKD